MADTLNWAGRTNGFDLLAADDVATINGTQVTTGTTTFGSHSTATSLIRTGASPSNYYSNVGTVEVYMNAAADDETSYQVTRIEFDRAVSNFSFTVLDIDGGFNCGNCSFNDIVEFSSSNGLPTSVAAGTGVAYSAGRASADDDTSTTGATTNLTVTWSVPVTWVEIKHIAGDVNGISNPNQQVIGVDDLTFGGTVKLRKQSIGGTASFTFAQTNLNATPAAINTAISNPGPASPTAIAITASDTDVTLTETPAGGYTATSASCTDANAAFTGNSGNIGILAGNVLTIAQANVHPAADFTCTFVNARATVAFSKLSVGGTANFTFNTPVNIAAAPGAINTGASNPGPAVPTVLNVTTFGAQVQLTEAAVAGYTMTGFICTDTNSAVTGNPANFGTFSAATRVVTIPAANIIAGANISCTITNTRATIAFRKLSVGGTANFSFNTPVNIAAAPGAINTALSNPGPAAPTVINVTNIGSLVRLTEAAVAGYTMTGFTCTDANSAVTGNPASFGTFVSATRVMTVPAANIVSGASITCTITNTRATVAFRKQSNGGTASFSFNTPVNIAAAPAAIDTTLSNPGPASPTAINITNVGNVVRLTEAAVTGYVMTGFTCTDANSAITGNPASFGTFVAATRVVTIPAGNVRSGSAITCTITNTRTATVQLAKVWGIAADATDSANIGATTGGTNNTSAFSTPGGTGANSGTAVTVYVGDTIAFPAETFTPAASASKYATVLSCTADGGATANSLSGTNGQASNTLVIGAGDGGKAVICTYTNNRRPRVSVQKTTTVTFGGPFTFSQTNLQSTPAPISTTAAATPTPASPARHIVTTTGNDVTLSESMSLAWASTGVVCTDLNAAGTGNPTPVATGSGAGVTIAGANVVAGSDINCLFQNEPSNPSTLVVKAASVASVDEAGDGISYTLTINNDGNVALASLTVSDPRGAVTCATSGNATIASLALSASETCTLSYVATQADFDSNGGGDGDIDNTATVSGSFNGTPFSDTGSTAVALIINPELTVDKTADTAGPVNAGNTINYTFTVTNTGNQTLANVGIADSHNGYGAVPVPGGMTLVDNAPFGDSSDDAADQVYDSLGPGDQLIYTSTYAVVQADIDLLQ